MDALPVSRVFLKIAPLDYRARKQKYLIKA